MSNWLRGIYNSAANFNLSNALRAASGRSMGRNAKQLRAVANESDKRIKSDQSSQSDQSYHGHACPCHCARTCNCISGECADNDGIDTDNGNANNDNNFQLRNQNGNEAGNKIRSEVGNKNGKQCQCEGCREYDIYSQPAAIRSEGQGAGSRIRFSDEPRNSKQPDSVSTSAIEYITGIRTGDAV